MTVTVTSPAVTSGPVSETIHVTPEQAQEWLAKNNISNRPMREARVAAYARDMTAGRWLFNGETIKFDVGKVLLDGQHRLAAVVRSGVTVPFIVVWGLPAEAQDTVDIGSTRTMSDALSLRDEPGARHLAAIARKVVMWERGYATQGGAGMATHQEMHAYIDAHPELREAVRVAQAARGAVPAAPSVIGAAYHLCARINLVDAERFYVDQVIRGLGLSEGDAAAVLRDRLQKHSVGGRQMHPDDVFRYSILAWNHFRSGSRITKLQAPHGGWTASNCPVPK